jgi:hypothetical protein
VSNNELIEMFKKYINSEFLGFSRIDGFPLFRLIDPYDMTYLKFFKLEQIYNINMFLPTVIVSSTADFCIRVENCDEKLLKL